MDIEALSDFRLVAVYGGFGKASRATGRPKATLSKRVIDLEANLGVRLFERTHGALQLTDEGRKLSSFVEELVDAMSHIRDELGATSQQPRGKLRVAAPSLFTYLCMGKFAADFMATFPDVQIETIIVEPPNEPAAEFFDVLIRVNPPPSSELIGRIFARDSVRVVASPHIAERIRLTPDEVADGISAVALTGVTKLGPWDLDLGERTVRVRPDIKLNLPSRLVIRDALCAGVGVAELPAALVAEDVRQGRIVDLGPAPTPGVELWVLYASRRLVSRRVSTFVSFLCDYFKNTPIAP